MEIRRRVAGAVAILELSGRFAVSPDEAEVFPLRSAINELIAEGRVHVALNLAGLLTTDARGLGELAFLFTLLRQHGGGLKLVAPTERVRRLLCVTRLNKIIPVYDGEMEAAYGAWA